MAANLTHTSCCLQCMLWSWYLADDTQFYVLGIILLILATR